MVFLHRSSGNGADIYFLTANHVTSLAEMDANLMRAAGFQSTGDYRVAIGDGANRLHMRDGVLRLRGLGSKRMRTTQAVATVTDEPTFDLAGFHLSQHDGDVGPLHFVMFESVN